MVNSQVSRLEDVVGDVQSWWQAQQEGRPGQRALRPDPVPGGAVGTRRSKRQVELLASKPKLVPLDQFWHMKMGWEYMTIYIYIYIYLCKHMYMYMCVHV